MAGKYFGRNSVSLLTQKSQIESTYSNVKSCNINHDKLICYMDITPSDNSDLYKVKIEYKVSESPKVWVLSPPLVGYKNKPIKHLYESTTPHQMLCIFYPGYNEWNKGMLLAYSFIPWISSWLNTYEYWLITGIWHYDESPHQRKKVGKYK